MIAEQRHCFFHCAAVASALCHSAFLCRMDLIRIVSLQYFPRSSIHHLAGLPCHILVVWYPSRVSHQGEHAWVDIRLPLRQVSEGCSGRGIIWLGTCSLWCSPGHRSGTCPVPPVHKRPPWCGGAQYGSYLRRRLYCLPPHQEQWWHSLFFCKR